MDKPSVRVLWKKGVSKGGSIGFEIETICDKDTSTEELVEIGKRCIAANRELMKEPMV